MDMANSPAYEVAICRRIDAVGWKNCALSAITVEELQRGVLTGPKANKSHEVRNLKAHIAKFRQIDFTPDAARRSAAVRVAVDQARPIKNQRDPGINDLLLAGHALAERRAVVTADAGFARVLGLKLENWRA